MTESLRHQIEKALLETGHNLPPIDETTDERETLDALIKELQPFDLAEVMKTLSKNDQLLLLPLIPREVAAETLDHLDYELRYQLLDHSDDSIAAEILARMPFDNLVDLLSSVHPLRAQVLYNLISEDRKPDIEEMLAFDEGTAGRHMTVSYLQARQEWTVERAIEHFRKVGEGVEITNYIYVVDHKGRPVGVASLRDILLSPANTTLEEIMYTKVVSVLASTGQEEAATILHQYDFIALPVVNDMGRLVGVVSVDDMVDVIQDEATEDIQMLGGSAPLEGSYLNTGLMQMFRSRIGWLLVLFVAESFTGTIMRNFENVLEQVVALAFFIPLLIDTGGNSGAQASTLVIRAMALGEVKPSDFFKIVWKEARLGLMLGIVMAIVAFLRAMMLSSPPLLGLTVAITICLIVLIGSSVGAALPLIGRRIGVDPAVLSAPLITTIADAVGLLIYFKVAVWLMNLS